MSKFKVASKKKKKQKLRFFSLCFVVSLLVRCSKVNYLLACSCTQRRVCVCRRDTSDSETPAECQWECWDLILFASAYTPTRQSLSRYADVRKRVNSHPLACLCLFPTLLQLKAPCVKPPRLPPSLHSSPTGVHLCGLEVLEAGPSFRPPPNL